jgi:NADH/F420H2 dehydrogenase subunit C
MEAGLKADDLLARLADLGGVRDPQDRWDLTVIVARERLVEAVTRLRDDPALSFDQLLDVTGVDYLSFAGWSGPRFAVIYVFKSTVFRHRLRLKVQLEETDATVPTLCGLYPIADWSERETWDQYGIVFAGHANLKRLLNHHEFTGHPLRKDYPCQKRQKLSLNDPMLDQLEARLKAQGWEILVPDAVTPGSPLVGEVKP